jgi:TPP-dependent pyruvate/acetoin dehydrogenase alpha subunit
MFDAQLYRPKAEVEEWKKRCPIERLEKWAIEAGILHETDLAPLETEVAREVQDAVAFAEAGSWEPVADLLRDVQTPRAVP